MSPVGLTSTSVIVFELEEVDWNFSKEHVPDREVVACSYWEFARESPFICGVKQRCVENWQEGGKRDQSLCDALEQLHTIGHAAEVFTRGFFFKPDMEWQSTNESQPNYRHPDAPGITGKFPQPWQKLSPKERACRACIKSDRDAVPILPIKRGDWHDAKEIASWCEARWMDVYAPYQNARMENLEMSEVEMIRLGKLAPFPGIRPSLFYESGTEMTVVKIAWGQFTNDEIAGYFRKWAHENRPKDIPVPNDQGRKWNDWRVALNRLGIMRALHAFTFADHRFPAVLKKRGEKYCYEARRLALKKFNELFPFLPEGEKPANWATKGGRSG